MERKLNVDKYNREFHRDVAARRRQNNEYLFSGVLRESMILALPVDRFIVGGGGSFGASL